MIYEFLYNSKPVNTYHITITVFWILIFLGFSVYNYCLSRPPKEKYRISKTLQYDANLQKEVVISQTIPENTYNSYEKKNLYEAYDYKCTILHHLLNDIRI